MWILLTPCEVAVKTIIPAIRALAAKELLEKYDMKQNEVAKILGISQSAVSKYTKKIRGHVIEIGSIEEIEKPLKEMIAVLVRGTNQRAEAFKFFCQTCTIIREKRLMCEFCYKTDPKIDINKCSFCSSNSNSKSDK